jgi:hypothetical protein
MVALRLIARFVRYVVALLRERTREHAPAPHANGLSRRTLAGLLLASAATAACATVGAAPPPPAPPPPSPPPPPPPPSAPPPTTVTVYRDQVDHLSATEPVLPALPPLPEPSTDLFLERSRFRSAHTLGDVDDILKRGVNGAGYTERSYYATPGGFALVVRLERMEPDARPAPQAQRFVPLGAPTPNDPFSIFSRLLFAPVGYYRQIVFTVTDDQIEFEGDRMTGPEAEALLNQGADLLPRSLRARPFSPRHRVRALVYEFEKSETAGARYLSQPRHTAAVHLTRAGVMSRLPAAN